MKDIEITGFIGGLSALTVMDYAMTKVTIPLNQMNFSKKSELGSGYKRPEDYKRFNRNDVCPCGSEIKYKKCHWKVWN